MDIAQSCQTVNKCNTWDPNKTTSSHWPPTDSLHNKLIRQQECEYAIWGIGLTNQNERSGFEKTAMNSITWNASNKVDQSKRDPDNRWNDVSRTGLIMLAKQHTNKWLLQCADEDVLGGGSWSVSLVIAGTDDIDLEIGLAFGRTVLGKKNDWYSLVNALRRF